MPTSPKRIIVAINPSASFGSRSATGPRVVDALAADGHSVIALTQPDFAALAASVRQALDAGGPAEADALVVVGGDGMVSLAVNATAESGIPFGIIPSGTGNDMARGLGIPLDSLDDALAVLRTALDSEARTIDAGRVHHSGGTTWFGGVLSAGFDALVNERANRMSRPRGASRYVIALLAELATLKARSYDLTVDGVSSSVSASLIAVANNTSLGGGMTITPDALVDDGRLDLFRVGALSRVRFLRLFPKVFSGSHTGLDIVEISRVSRVHIDADEVIAYADGERVGPLPVEVEVVAGALRVLA
jgi:diacylglycerol kinase (ATP)